MTRLSLIVPSIHRRDEVSRLFVSLGAQTCQDFEVILVDQNVDDRLVSIVQQYTTKLAIQHIRVQSLGASRARNAGFPYAQGDMILWPDDDSWLPPELLEKILIWAGSNPDYAGAIGVLIDERGYPHTRWTPQAARPATLMDAFTRAAEPVLFFRRVIVQALGGFDDQIGTGAQTPWGAGEGTDLCVRALNAGYHLGLEPLLRVYHARIEIQPSDQLQMVKARAYARGMGAVIRKNKLPSGFVAKYAFTYLRAIGWNAIRGRWVDVQFHRERWSGVLEGYFKSRHLID